MVFFCLGTIWRLFGVLRWRGYFLRLLMVWAVAKGVWVEIFHDGDGSEGLIVFVGLIAVFGMNA